MSRSTSDTPGSVFQDRLLRAREVMQVLGVSRSTAYRLMTDGTLPVVRLGGTRRRARTALRVRQSSLTRWVEENEYRPEVPEGFTY